MLYNIKNYNLLKTWKTFSSNYYKICKYSIINLLKNKFVNINNKNFSICVLDDFLFFKKTNFSSIVLDGIQEFNYKMLIFLPIKIKNLKTGKILIIYYLIGDLPIFSCNKDLIINGYKKTYLCKLTLNKLGIFFNSFLKDYKYIFYTKIKLLPINLIFNILLFGTKCFFVLNNRKIDILSFLSISGISFIDILKYSRYKKSFYLKKLLFNSKFKSNYINSISFILSILNHLYKLNFNKSYIYKKILKEKYTKLNKLLIKLLHLDFIYILDILIDIKLKKVTLENIDNLNNKSINTLGNYFINQYSYYLNKKVNLIKKDIEKITTLYTKTHKHINFSYIKSNNYFSLNKYLTINPSVQYLEQINSLSEEIHKNKIINYESKLKKNLENRDVNLNQLGSICLINTSEGINCGLVVSFSKNTILKNNKVYFSYSDFFKQKKKSWTNFIKFSNIKYYKVIFELYWKRKNKLTTIPSLGLYKENFKLKNISLNKTLIINPSNLFSYAENLIPFLFFNEPTRSLMASKMSAQSVPLIKNKKSFILTNYEKNNIFLNSNLIKAYQEGIIIYISSTKIILKDLYHRKITYYLNKYKRSNNGTFINQKPSIWIGERILTGQVLTSSQDIINNEFAIGNNLIISYGNFFGYNFEDAIVINKKIVYSNLFTSLHFDIYDINICSIYNKKIELSVRNIPIKNSFVSRNLNRFGIIKEGSKIIDEDIIISKIIINDINKHEIHFYNIISLLLGFELRNIKDNSFVSSLGNSGRIIKTELFNQLKNNKYLLKCRVYLCKQRFLRVGDKLCGRYGNKGVIAYIISRKDLPFTNNGTMPDILTDSLGVPSRLNIGQLFESLLGIKCFLSNKRLCISNKFNISKTHSKILIYQYLKQLKEKTGFSWLYNSYIPGQMFLRNGQTGFKFLEPSFIGMSKYSKLIHMVKDKIHYRTIGPYTEIIQQPVKGRNKMGGQRFGEMEIWALEAYGSSYNIRELLNYKSDDLIARHSLTNTFSLDNIISIPESFRTVLRELQGLSLNFESFINIDNLEGNLIPLNINF